MLAHLQAVTTDVKQLRGIWAPSGVLEFPYAPAGTTSRIEGIDGLVAFFDAPRRWSGWAFEPVRIVVDRPRRLHVAEIHATATWVKTEQPYVQDYVVFMELDNEGRIAHWREYWDRTRV
jgi:ketosteroid isomerase-like protein